MIHGAIERPVRVHEGIKKTKDKKDRGNKEDREHREGHITRGTRLMN